MARTSGVPLAQLGLRALSPAVLLAWAAAATAGGVGIMLAARALGVRESAFLRRLLPASGSEKVAFAGLSLSAGFGEELVFRGFLLVALRIAWGSQILALLVSSVAFGWMHAYQHPAGAMRAGLLGSLLAIPLVLSGSIWPSMIAHSAIDIIGGLLLRRRLLPEMA